MIGHAYAAAGYHFGPYKQATRTNWVLGVAGKLMAYIALGSVDENIVRVFQELYEEHFGTMQSSPVLTVRGLRLKLCMITSMPARSG